MKPKLFLIAFFVTIKIFAQETLKADSTKFSEIKFEVLEHDFGTLQKGDNCIFYFKFTNTGNEPLIILNAKTSCGCDIAYWPKVPIMPGKSAVIKYQYDSQRIGGFHQSTTVTSNAKNGTVLLKVKGLILDSKLPSDIKPQIEGN